MLPVTSLSKRKHRLSAPAEQLRLLDDMTDAPSSFAGHLRQGELFPLRPKKLTTLQVNVGKMCNQTCRHCHVDAGPDRKEVMTRHTMSACLDALRNHPFETLDLTGGAPEMNPDFQWLVERAAPWVDKIIVRSNLTILVSNQHYRKLPDFFREHRLEVVSSLPFYAEKRTDAQRGNGVFKASIEALKILNSIGYGLPDGELNLHLVYNPTGSFLPGDQATLEAEFKKRLQADFGLHFNRLFTITNLPISRFLEYLVDSGNITDYMDRLIEAYNPAAAAEVMCRSTLSVGWDGRLYDCDFNQMLELPLEGAATIEDFDPAILQNREINVANHCFGCTAGAGSSCGGALTGP